jgi:hypothetical protein
LIYGSVVEIVERTNIKYSVADSLKTTEGQWVKVAYTNFPFKNNEMDSDGYMDTAFVFDGFLQAMDYAQIVFTNLSKKEFEKLKNSAKSEDPETIKIDDFAKAKMWMGNRTKWVESEYGYPILESIVLDNGKILTINQTSYDCGFSYYFPTEEIILFECGHTSDLSISLKTGESTETVGEPRNYITSADGNLRLNALFPGQECYDYFLQVKTEKGFRNIASFGWGGQYGTELCAFDYFGWISNTEFIYSTTLYDEEEPRVLFVKGKINLN